MTQMAVDIEMRSPFRYAQWRRVFVFWNFIIWAAFSTHSWLSFKHTHTHTKRIVVSFFITFSQFPWCNGTMVSTKKNDEDSKANVVVCVWLLNLIYFIASLNFSDCRKKGRNLYSNCTPQTTYNRSISATSCSGSQNLVEQKFIFPKRKATHRIMFVPRRCNLRHSTRMHLNYNVQMGRKHFAVKRAKKKLWKSRFLCETKWGQFLVTFRNYYESGHIFAAECAKNATCWCAINCKQENYRCRWKCVTNGKAKMNPW